MDTRGPSHLGRAGPVAAACAAIVLLVTGCEQRVVSTSYGNLGGAAADWPSARPDAAGRDAPRRGDRSGGLGALFDSGDGADADAMRTIALADFEGPDRRQHAEQFRDRLASRTGAEDLWLADEGERIMLYHGRYGPRDERRAREDLERWRRLRAFGTAPVSYVMLTPIRQVEHGSRPEYELSSAASRGSISLQIGIYEGEGRREMAEQAAADLRQEGHEAYYYHGPNYSHITIGAFPASEILPDGSHGPRLEQARQRFPYNLGNGRTLRVRQPDGTVIDQPSFPVAIPDSPGS